MWSKGPGLIVCCHWIDLCCRRSFLHSKPQHGPEQVGLPHSSTSSCALQLRNISCRLCGCTWAPPDVPPARPPDQWAALLPLPLLGKSYPCMYHHTTTVYCPFLLTVSQQVWVFRQSLSLHFTSLSSSKSSFHVTITSLNANHDINFMTVLDSVQYLSFQRSLQSCLLDFVKSEVVCDVECPRCSRVKTIPRLCIMITAAISSLGSLCWLSTAGGRQGNKEDICQAALAWPTPGLSLHSL